MQCSSVTETFLQLRVLFPHALGPQALLRHRKPAFHHLELLSAQAVTWHRRPSGPASYCAGTHAGALPFCRNWIRGHARARASADLGPSAWQSLQGDSSCEAELFPAAGYNRRIRRSVLATSLLRFQSLGPTKRG